jgi:tRNA threonylcarbamoyladenosine biosynthesis protein TsaB
VPYSAATVCPLLDARKKEVYAATYRFEGAGMVQIMAEAVIPLSHLSGRIDGTVLFTGEASHLFREDIVKLFGDRALFAPIASLLPSAATVAGIGLDMIKSGKKTDVDSLTPMYIRRPEAEVAWEKRMQSQ